MDYADIVIAMDRFAAAMRRAQFAFARLARDLEIASARANGEWNRYQMVWEY